MSRLQLTARMLTAWLAVGALLVLLVLIWGLRPALPNLYRSPTGPPAHVIAKQIAALIAWILVMAFTLYLLTRVVLRTVRAGLPRSQAAADRLEHALASQPKLDRRRASRVHLSAPQAYPLIIRSHDQLPPQTTACEPSTTATTAMLADPPRPSTGRSISILGPLKIEGARQKGRKLRSLTAQMLLYLVLHHEGATVEQLADTLLPDTNPDQSRNRLWQSATEARKILGDGFTRDNDGRYTLDRTTVQIDLDQLDRALNNLNDHRQSEDPSDTEDCEHALELFRGQPLPDIDWTWAEGHIRHLRATYVNLIEQAGQASLQHGDPRHALELAEKGLEIDKLNEALWRLAMQADSAAGLRDSVNQRYTQLSHLLDQQFGLEPDAETRGLYRDLLGQN